jgi:hypothetical protein
MTRSQEQGRGVPRRPAVEAERASVRVLALVFLGIVTAAAWDGTAMAGSGHAQLATAGQENVEQTECPVMIGNRIDPSIFVIYRGQKVYFCCPTCKSAFEKAPEKYLGRLPQFASVAHAAGEEVEGHDDHEHADGGFSAASMIEPMGAVTLSLVALTVCLGFLRRVRRLSPRLVLRLHKTCGVSALAAGAIHATLVLVAH